MLVANVEPRLRRTFEILGVDDLLAYDTQPAPRFLCTRPPVRPRRAGV